VKVRSQCRALLSGFSRERVKLASYAIELFEGRTKAGSHLAGRFAVQALELVRVPTRLCDPLIDLGPLCSRCIGVGRKFAETVSGLPKQSLLLRRRSKLAMGSYACVELLEFGQDGRHLIKPRAQRIGPCSGASASRVKLPNGRGLQFRFREAAEAPLQRI
jgi:hypothetical protein